MKILVDARGLQEGFKQHKHRGIGHYSASVIEGLLNINNNKYQFDFLADASLTLDNLVFNSGNKLLHQPSSLLKTFIRSYESYITLKNTINKFDYNLVHFLSHEDATISLKIPYLVTIHDVIGLTNAHLYSGLQRLKHRIKHRFTHNIVKKASGIIAISNYTKKDIIKYYNVDESKIRVIHHGVHNRFFINKSAESKLKIRKKYNLPEDYILYVGGIDPRKNIKNMLKGLSLLYHKTQLNIPLVFAGKISNQTEYPEILRVIKELNIGDKVVIAGYIPEEDLPFVYSSALVFLYPSLYEGFGLPILQAMAAGVPVVTSPLSSIPEVTGDAAIYVDPLDPDNIAANIEKIIADSSLRELTISAGKTQAKKFSWEKTITELLFYYDYVLDNLN